MYKNSDRSMAHNMHQYYTTKFLKQTNPDFLSDPGIGNSTFIFSIHGRDLDDSEWSYIPAHDPKSFSFELIKEQSEIQHDLIPSRLVSDNSDCESQWYV